MRGKNVLLKTFLLLTLLAISGCGFVADGPFGWAYTDTIMPIAVGNATSGSKTGRACIHSFFGGVSIGDASIERAMRDGDIKDIFTVNKSNLSMFGTYTRQCTIVRGE